MSSTANPTANRRNQKTNTVTQLRAQLSDQKSTVTITSTDLNDVQRKIANVLGGSPHYGEPTGNVRFIYHDRYLNGEQPCGWIAELEVPEALSVKNVTESRMAAQRAA